MPSRPQLATLLEQRQQIGKTAAGRMADQGLGRVDGAAAPQGHDHGHLGMVTLHLLVQRRQPLHIGIGGNAVDHAAKLRSQQLAHALHQAQALGLGKGDQQAAAPGQQGRQLIETVATHADMHGVVIGPHEKAF